MNIFNNYDPLTIGLLLGGLAFLPVILTVCTSFLKISIVIMILRNALGVQQIPGNMVVYGLSLILTFYVMSPVVSSMSEKFTTSSAKVVDVKSMIDAVGKASEPLNEFLYKHSNPASRAFFLDAAIRYWPKEHSQKITQRSWIIVAPSFVVSEITRAFEIGFLLYLPFIIVDLVVSNVLLALGMQMVSPTTISLPLKLLLFVIADGWTRLLHGLILSYF